MNDNDIVQGFLDDADAFLRTVALRGADVSAVRARAVAMGLSREFIKQCKLSSTRPAMRGCVKCDAAFLSAGFHNRLCRCCRPR